MGITIAEWQRSLINELKASGHDAAVEIADGYHLIDFREAGKLVLNRISLETDIDPQGLINLQHQYQSNGIQLVQLWEDIWLSRKDQVLSRIFSLMGKNKKVHGRKTKIRSLTQPEADQFLDQHHLQGSVTARFRYALQTEGQVVAVALFSGKRKMTRNSPDYTSIELMRFANATGSTVQGGLSKLIKHVITTHAPNDVMSYADLDWSYGKGYSKLGFELVEQSPPAEIWLNHETLIRYFPHRLPAEIKALLPEPDSANKIRSLHYSRVYNTGNLKYISYL